MDLSLPDSHGLESVRRVRLGPVDVPIVVLTGLADEKMAVDAVNAGAQDYLVKGRDDPAILARAIRYARERHRMTSELRKLALVDELTGLNNRRGFMMVAEHHAKLADRDRSAFEVLFIDLNNMKKINDTLGHQGGDRALTETADLLRKTFRESDVLGRVGGDEFCVLLAADPAKGDGSGQAAGAAIRLRDNLERHNAASTTPFELSLSIGGATYDPDEPESIDDLLARADQAMYEEKTTRAAGSRLLVIDDDPSIARLIAVILGDDHTILAAEAGLRGIEMAESEKPDLIVLDLNLPDVAGHEVARRLREKIETSRVPILMLTGTGDERDEVAGLEAGVDDYVEKPFNEAALRARIERLIKRARRR